MDSLTTKQTHAPQGRYSAERLAVHEAIIAETLRGHSPSTNRPEAIFMGGGSASGKSTIRNEFVKKYSQDGWQAVVIDPDAIKSLLPEYQTLVNENAELAADVVHDESSDLGEKLFSRCLEQRLTFVYDGTMKNLEKYDRLIDQARALGYKTTAVIADVPLETALRREELRFAEEGRRVPREVVEATHALVPQTVNRLNIKLDTVMMFDTSKSSPELFYSKINGEIALCKEARLEQFLAKSSALEAGQPRIVHLDQPKPMKEILQSAAEGLPSGSHLTANFLNQKIRQYTLTVDAKGKEQLDYRVDGQNQSHSLALNKVPHLSGQRRNEWLDRASETSSLSNPARLRDKER